MCGVAGYVFQDQRVCDAELRGMTGQLSHRGPDGQGMLSHAGWGLGHNLLKIMDLSDASRQPLTHPSGRFHMSFNGEIYNHSRLVEKHGLRKSRGWKSQTDCEPLMEMLASLGERALPELEGVFAFAHYDARTRTMRLVRDPMGVKPLYYALVPGGMWFASEPGSLLDMPGVVPERDYGAINDYFSLGYFPGETTPWRGVRQLPAGCCLRYERDSGTVSLVRYFHLEDMVSHVGGSSRRELAEETRRLVEEVFLEQLMGQAPVGLMLSGGIDSTVLAALMGKHGSKGFHSYTLSFSEPGYDETQVARKVAHRVGSTHHVVPIRAESYRQDYQATLSRMGQPMADSSAPVVYRLAELASKDVRVLMSGDGGDELFGGYETLDAAFLQTQLSFAPPEANHKIVRWLESALPVAQDKQSFLFRVNHFLKAEGHDPPSAVFKWRESLPMALKERLFRGKLREGLRDSSGLFRETFKLPSGWDGLNRLLFIDATLHFRDKVQLKTDRMTMAHGIEARVPLADPRLFKWAFSLPGQAKYSPFRSKRLLREAFASDLAHRRGGRGKRGLLVPFSGWMRGSWRGWMDQAFLSEGDWCEDLCPVEVRNLWLRHREGKADHAQALFALLGYIEWGKLSRVSLNGVHS